MQIETDIGLSFASSNISLNLHNKSNVRLGAVKQVHTDTDERRKIVVKYKRCFPCLREGHQVKKCRDKAPCSNCDKTGYHLSICKEATTHRHFSVKGAISYQTVQAKVNIPGKAKVKCRKLIDTGSL